MVTDLKFVKCREVNFTKHQNLTNEFLDSNQNYSRHCFDFKDNHHIQNEADVPESSTFNLILAFCNPKLRESCKIEDRRMNSKLRNPVLIVSYINSFVKSHDYDHPMKSYATIKNIDFSEGLMKINTFKITNDIFISDDGWMLTDNREYTEAAVSEIFSDVSIIDSGAPINKIYSLFLVSSRLRQKTVRNYMKLQELLARVGGVANAVMILVYTISYHFLRFQYMMFIREHSFNLLKKKSLPSVSLIDQSKIKEENNQSNVCHFTLLSKTNNPLLNISKENPLNINMCLQNSQNNQLPMNTIQNPDLVNSVLNKQFGVTNNNKVSINNANNASAFRSPNVSLVENKQAIHNLNKEEGSSILNMNDSKENRNQFQNNRPSINSISFKGSLRNSIDRHSFSPKPNSEIIVGNNCSDNNNSNRENISNQENKEASEAKECAEKLVKSKKGSFLYTEKALRFRSEIVKALSINIDQDEEKKLSYFEYVLSDYFFCCLKKETTNLYQREINKVSNLLNFNVFQLFLIESYTERFLYLKE
mmetsp:Transcript_267/g.251  ORF Transcript_267/g.251 Transcript_267/m.251 type:complete len:534 (-) Transcript_267:73-1674(-)